jgi:hypothetical protein
MKTARIVANLSLELSSHVNASLVMHFQDVHTVQPFELFSRQAVAGRPMGILLFLTQRGRRRKRKIQKK